MAVIRIPLVTNDVEPLLMCLFSSSIQSLVKFFFFFFRSFDRSKKLRRLLINNFFINFSTSPLSCVCFANIFSLWLSFSFS